MKRLEELRVDYLGTTLFINTNLYTALEALENTKDAGKFLQILTNEDVVALSFEKAEEYGVEAVDKATTHLLEYIGSKLYRVNNNTEEIKTPLMCINQDATYIYSALLQAYGVDIDKQELDYRRFTQLISSIHNTHYNEVINIRAKPFEKGKGMENYNEELRKAKKAVALKKQEDTQQQEKDKELIAQAFGRW